MHFRPPRKVRFARAVRKKIAPGYALRAFPAQPHEKRTIHLLQNRTVLFVSDRQATRFGRIAPPQHAPRLT